MSLGIPEFLRLVGANQSAMLHAQRLYCDRLAPDFNPFDFIQPDEVGLSKILNWLLDPTGITAKEAAFFIYF